MRQRVSTTTTQRTSKTSSSFQQQHQRHQNQHKQQQKSKQEQQYASIKIEEQCKDCKQHKQCKRCKSQKEVLSIQRKNESVNEQLARTQPQRNLQEILTNEQNELALLKNDQGAKRQQVQQLSKEPVQQQIQECGQKEPLYEHRLKQVEQNSKHTAGQQLQQRNERKEPQQIKQSSSDKYFPQPEPQNTLNRQGQTSLETQNRAFSSFQLQNYSLDRFETSHSQGSSLINNKLLSQSLQNDSLEAQDVGLSCNTNVVVECLTCFNGDDSLQLNNGPTPTISHLKQDSLGDVRSFEHHLCFDSLDGVLSPDKVNTYYCEEAKQLDKVNTCYREDEKQNVESVYLKNLNRHSLEAGVVKATNYNKTVILEQNLRHDNIHQGPQTHMAIVPPNQSKLNFLQIPHSNPYGEGSDNNAVKEDSHCKYQLEPNEEHGQDQREQEPRMSSTAIFFSMKLKQEELRKRRTNRLLVLIAVVFAASWMPLNLANIMADFSFESVQSFDARIGNLLFPICHLLVLCSACVNPVLYGWLNDNFRREFVRLLCCLRLAVVLKRICWCRCFHRWCYCGECDKMKSMAMDRRTPMTIELTYKPSLIGKAHDPRLEKSFIMAS